MNSRDWWNDNDSFSDEDSSRESQADAWFNSNPSPSFSSSASSQRALTIGSTSSGLTSSSSFFSHLEQIERYQPPVQLINCERENIFAELLFYARKITYNFGNVCPTSSPVKPANPSERTLGLASLPTITALDIEISRKNTALDNYTHYNHGRNFSQLHGQLKKLYNHLKQLGSDGFKQFMADHGITELNKYQLKAAKKLPVAHLVVLLKLSNKFPLTSKSELLENLQIAVKDNQDIYKVYPQLKSQLLKSTLTNKALSAYLTNSPAFDEMEVDSEEKPALKGFK